MEMPLQAVEARIASSATYDRHRPKSGVPYAWALNQNLTSEENGRFVRAGLEMGKLPITIEERASLSTADIALLVRRCAQDFIAKRQRLSVVIVDLLTKVRARDLRAQVHDQLTQISKDLTALAKTEDVALLVLHQLNRGVEDRDNKRPRKSDLRGSGSLEEDADGIWMLFREGYYEQRADNETAEDTLARQLRLKRLEHKMEIIVEKNRHGPTGTADVFCALECNVIQDNDENGGGR
jgi:replicative DNA helicase